MVENERKDDNTGDSGGKSPKKLRVLLRTFGCQMNIRDSEFAMGMLLDSGFGKANSVDDADVVLFNSCSVRKHAEDRLFSNIADLNNRKKKRPGLVVGLIGCAAQNYKDKALKRAPIVDFVTGPGNIGDIPYIIKDILKNRCPIIATDKVDKKREELFPEYREGDFKTYVSISEGCGNFCSYCIVPYVRGRERSRDAMDIIREVNDLAERGFKEITLLGQNVNSYGKDQRPKTIDHRPMFVKLLEEL
ncbi:MAG: radical SAM protein, partial [Candidatus Omnitrophota bacterium]|nr:radical SAM protein [Candidatus Omnitrophota bacterium]